MGAMKQVWIIVASLVLLTLGAVQLIRRQTNPPIESVVASALKSVQEQNRLSAFAARFVTVATSTKSRFGLSAQKTLIIPAVVRYEIDLAKLGQDDLIWNTKSQSLLVRLPAIELAGPEFDLNGTREYESGMILLSLTDVERRLDAENRARATEDVLAQARADAMMKLARAATQSAIVSSFALPLRAAGIDAHVKVEFNR